MFSFSEESEDREQKAIEFKKWLERARKREERKRRREVARLEKQRRRLRTEELIGDRTLIGKGFELTRFYNKFLNK